MICTPGHREACWTARGPVSDCVCDCGGEHHGIYRDRTSGQEELEMALELTDPKVFEPRHDDNGWEIRDRTLKVVPVDHIQLERMTGGQATVTGVPHTFVCHSPTGFEWGYHGSGPAELALNILAIFVNPREAWLLHQTFKSGLIANVPKSGIRINPRFVRQWIKGQWETEDEAAPKCRICSKRLNQPGDESSMDCGGDCWGCVKTQEP